MTNRYWTNIILLTIIASIFLWGMVGSLIMKVRNMDINKQSIKELGWEQVPNSSVFTIHKPMRKGMMDGYEYDYYLEILPFGIRIEEYESGGFAGGTNNTVIFEGSPKTLPNLEMLMGWLNIPIKDK